MTAPIWQAGWLDSARHRIRAAPVWRGVETQYASATTLLVDGYAEHDALEQLLEASKPPLLAMKARSKHFLLLSPFRYTPVHDSRFRRAGRHGLWYGARALKAACAEVAYWRMRFIQDSAGLAERKIITHHTFFAAVVQGIGINLMMPPWDAGRSVWTGDDYQATHALADAAGPAGIEVIQYESARAPGLACLAVLTPDALSEPRGGLDATRQKWTCTATRDHVMMADRDGAQRHEWGPFRA